MDNNITIQVENLGPLKGPETIVLRPFLIFSGVSGVGKSYIAMLSHFVYRVIAGNELLHYLVSSKIDYDVLKQSMTGDEGLMCKISVSEFGDWIDRRALSYMREMLGNVNFSAKIHIDLPNLPEYFTFSYSRNVMMSQGSDVVEYVETLKFIEADDSIQMPQGEGTWSSFPFMFMLNRYLRKKYGIQPGRTFFLPPSRGSLVAVPDDVRVRMQQSMGMYKIFLNDLSALKSMNMSYKQSEAIEKANNILHDEVLHGDINVKDNEMVYQVENTEIPITAAASSIKEIAPFALMIQKGLLNTYSILFEEPESHLHPELQVKVAELLGYALQEGAHLQITTHSDYLVRSLNDLIRLHILKEKMEKEQFLHYCAEKKFNPDIDINPEDVAAYYLELDASGVSHITRQDVSMGIPFDSFKKVIDNQMARSADLYDQVGFFLEQGE